MINLKTARCTICLNERDKHVK